MIFYFRTHFRANWRNLALLVPHARHGLGSYARVRARRLESDLHPFPTLEELDANFTGM
jgi:hypothetical protein